MRATKTVFVIGFTLVVFAFFISVDGGYAGEWGDESTQGSKSTTNAGHIENGGSPTWMTKCLFTEASEEAGAGGDAYAEAEACIYTYGVWTGTYLRSTPAATATFSGKKVMKHTGSPSHDDVKGIYTASGEARASFQAECFVRTDAKASCGGSASADLSISGVSGKAAVDVDSVGCTTASGGFPIGFTVHGGTGVSGVTNTADFYNSGLRLSKYTLTTPETEPGVPH